MKILTVVGARPQFIKAAVVSRLLRSKAHEVLVHTGQHYDYNMSDIFFEELDIPRPDYNLGISGGTHGQMTGKMLAAIEEVLLAEKPDKEKLAFVGDGINDAPVLMRADIGIAMGALGSDAAIEAADVVLMDDDPMKIAKAIKISRKCIRIVHENIVFSLGVKLLCLLLVALGFANMWMGIFADVGVMVLAVLNAIRALRVHNL